MSSLMPTAAARCGRHAPDSGDKVIELHEELARSFTQSMSQLIRYASINGLPGFITIEAGDVLQTTALEVAADKIVGIYVMRNPDKLRHLDDAAVH